MNPVRLRRAPDGDPIWSSTSPPSEATSAPPGGTRTLEFEAATDLDYVRGRHSMRSLRRFTPRPRMQ